MNDLENLKDRVRQILDDGGDSRFSETLLENAVRQAMARLDDKLPQMRVMEHTVVSPGRDQVLSGLQHPLFLVKLVRLDAMEDDREREIDAGVTFTLNGESGLLHFGGGLIPQTGDRFLVHYAAGNILAGLDEAETTSLPEAAIPALECASAGMACLLRSAAVSEAYGARPGESNRLTQQSRLWLDAAEKSLASLQSRQEFDSPRGFALDAWDKGGRLP